MTRPHAQSRHIRRQTSEIPLKLFSMPNDVGRAELSLHDYQEAATRKLQRGAAQTPRLGVNHGSDTFKWPKGPVTAGVVTASLLLWALIVAAIRFV